MIVVGIIEDQWVDLLKVSGNFLVHASRGAAVEVRPYLLASAADFPDKQDILDLQEEVRHYHPQVTFPSITALSPVDLRDTEQTRPILRRLADDGVNVLVSDSQIGDDEVGGLWLLDSALAGVDQKHRGWTCHLMTKHFESASKWIYTTEKGMVDSRIRFLDKTKLLASFPDECSDAVMDLLEREECARAAAAAMAGKGRFGRFVGSSSSLNSGPTSPYAIAQIAATTDSSILIRGETGVGKEVLARAIHEQSARKNQPFVAVDCGALADALIESELFGHKKGAFTGATADYDGRIRQANKGTLFLDEITNLPLASQKKLLRVLAEHEVMPLGGKRTEPVDFRLISATNAPIERLIEAERFLHDLFDRINTWPITLPPLRERRDDIPALVADLVPRLAPRVGARRFYVSDQCMPILQEATWSANVRSLSNCLERSMGFALQTADGQSVTVTPEHIRLALPKVQALAELPAPRSSVERPDPTKSMTAKEIWTGLHDDKLRRQSLSELVRRLGSEKVGAVIMCADAEDAIVKPRGLEKYFPGSTQANKRAIRSRYLKRSLP